MPKIILSPQEKERVNAWNTIEAIDAKILKNMYEQATKVSKNEAYKTLEEKLEIYLKYTRSVEALTKNIKMFTDKMNTITETIENVKMHNTYMNANTIKLLHKLEGEKQSCIPYIVSYTKARLNTMKAQKKSYTAYMEAFKVWDKLM